MRSVILLAASVFALVSCQPETKPAEPTFEELGQDDPNVPFVPAPVGEPRTYEAYSKTAMSFTPGVLTLTPTPQQSPNLPSGAVFAFGNGIRYETTLTPGGAMMGATPFDWSKVFVDATGAPIDPEKVEMYSVDQETVPAGAPNGGLCEKASFLATYIVRSPGAEDLTIAAFGGDQWPPRDETALCGAFTYASVH